MEPVRVKIYGLTSMTRRGYLTQLAVAAVIVVGILGFWWFRWPEVRPDPANVRVPILQRAIDFWDHAPWVAGVVAVLLMIEAWIVLRRFACKEAERAAQQAAKPQTSDTPRS